VKAASVRRAESVVREANAALQSLRDRVIAGDEEVTAAQLAEAAGAVDLAKLRLEAAERDVERVAREAEEEQRQAAVSAYERRARRHRAETRQAELDSFRSAVEAGTVSAPFLEQIRLRPHTVDPEILAIWQELEPQGQR
jgi:hypothetical protein